MSIDDRELVSLRTPCIPSPHVYLLTRRPGASSRFDSSFYRTNATLGCSLSSIESPGLEATYSSGSSVAVNGPFGAGHKDESHQDTE